MRRAGNIVLKLRDQGRHQVKRLVQPRKFIQQFHHAVIILERVQTHPGQAVFATDQVLVIRLVHVPEEQEMDCRRTH